MSNQPVATTTQQSRAPATVKDLLATTNYQSRLKEVLGERAPQFAASIVQITNGSAQLKACDPHSLIAAAMTAAILDLPIDKNLGFAHIIPYKSMASFQMGYKGLIQLAVRSGQYRLLNACVVHKGELVSFNELTGELVLDPEKQDGDEVVGYAAYFKLVNGYEHACYWSKEKVTKHAGRYSQAYKAKKQDSPWFTNFDSMALKTTVKDLISHWGIMSVQMQRAVVEDQGVRRNIDSEVDYIDNDPSPSRPVHTLDVESTTVESPAKQAFDEHAPAPDDSNPDLQPVEKSADKPADAKAPTEAEQTIIRIADLAKGDGVNEWQIVQFARKNKMCPSKATSLSEFTDANLKKVESNWQHFVENVKAYPAK